MQDADGVGLAATQVGILRRFFVFRDEEDALLVVNPEITSSSREKRPTRKAANARAGARSRRAVARRRVEGLDGEGAPLKLELEGLAARVAQHELDHLEGTLILQRTDPESRREALKLLRPRLALA